MITTKAKKDFKKRLGQANHLLITVLVGLDAIENGIVSEKPESFDTSWNPIAPTRSAARARFFTLKSFLGWTVESLEMYLAELHRKPKELDTHDIRQLYSQAGQSIYKKVIGVGIIVNADPVLIALMEVLVTWRNYTFHYDIDNKIRDESYLVLKDNAHKLKEDYCGLEIDKMRETWECNGDFTFKETASLIRATHKFVDEVDRYVIQNFNMCQYVLDSLEQYFEAQQQKLHKIKSLPSAKKKRYLRNLIKDTLGINTIRESEIDEILVGLKLVKAI